MTNRAYNFNAGPAALPLEVLQEAQTALVDYKGIGMSLMEISHRSKEYENINGETQELIKELLSVPSGYKVLFMQGGASTQFGMIPMNFLKPGKVGSYILTGSWADKAYKEAQLFGQVEAAASSQAIKFTGVPSLKEIVISPDSAYLHLTSNETIGGIQFSQFPDTGSLPLLGDMSSDIMCRPIDVSKFAFVYAGAQKNLGPSGVTVVIIREDLLQDIPQNIATMSRYTTYSENNSLYNTPPAYSIHIMNLVLQWIKRNGGLLAMEQRNKEKSQLIYDAIDGSGDFYQGVARKESRSLMNITFRLKDQGLEKNFVQESEQQGFVGLPGHRSVGGLRASAYNAVPYESCKALKEFMVDFQSKNS